MSEMVDRVAKALEARLKGNEFLSYEDAARAAIEAMRQPTQAMIEAGAVGSGEDSEAVAEGAWEYMIDAALKPATTGDMR